MAIAQLPGERVRAYGSVSPADGSRGNGRRAVAAAAVATLLLVGAVMLSGGGGGGRADVLSMESEELGSADAMKKRMGILMGRFSMLDANGTAAADAAAASKAAAEGAEAAAAAGNAQQAAAPAKCSGNPMETYESFSCWLAQYKDPEDVEVRIHCRIPALGPLVPLVALSSRLGAAHLPPVHRCIILTLSAFTSPSNHPAIHSPMLCMHTRAPPASIPRLGETGTDDRTPPKKTALRRL